MSAWVWGSVASGLVLLAAGKSTSSHRPQWQLFRLGTAAVRVMASLIGVFTPAMVIGNGPTAPAGPTIPIAALIAPLFALVVCSARS